MPPQFLAYLVILCFERRYPKQNTVTRLKSKILDSPAFLPLQNFGLRHWSAQMRSVEDSSRLHLHFTTMQEDASKKIRSEGGFRLYHFVPRKKSTAKNEVEVFTKIYQNKVILSTFTCGNNHKSSWNSKCKSVAIITKALNLFCNC